MTLPEDVRLILSRLNNAGYDAFVVGGCVRDALLGRPIHDWDICTAARPDEVHAVFAGMDIRDTGLQHGTVSLILGHEPYEITTFRVDGPYSDRRHPDSVAFTRTIRDDLQRRDLTINAMAYSPDTGLIDPFDGQADLDAGLLRCVGSPSDRFSEDALRILRAMRFASRLGFAIEPDTAGGMRALSGLLRDIAPERIKTELEGILTGGHVLPVLLDFPDILTVPIPEIASCVGFDQQNPYHIYDVWEHTAHSVSVIPDDPILRWTMLLHDLGKPACFTLKTEGHRGHFYGHGRVSAGLADDIMRRLRFSVREHELIRELVEKHDSYLKPDIRAVRRELSRIGPEQFFRAVEVRIADIRAQNPDYAPDRLAEMEHIRSLGEQCLAEGSCLSLRDLAVNGRDLLALGFAPGPAIGAELDHLLALVLEDPSRNDREFLLTEAAKHIS